MRLRKLRSLSISIVVLACGMLVYMFVSKSEGDSLIWFVVALCLLVSALELVRIELEDLWRAINHEAQVEKGPSSARDQKPDE